MAPATTVFRFISPNILRAPSTCGMVAVPALVGSVESWVWDHVGEPPPHVLVLDLSGVEAWDTNVRRPLVWARRRCLQTGADAVLRLPCRPILRRDEIDDLRQAFTITEQLPEAHV